MHAVSTFVYYLCYLNLIQPDRLPRSESVSDRSRRRYRVIIRRLLNVALRETRVKGLCVLALTTDESRR